MSRYTISVDFDGVIHDHRGQEWKGPGTILGPPVVGALDWLAVMVRSFRVEVLSTRGRTLCGRVAMSAWLKAAAGKRWGALAGYSGLSTVHFVAEKGPALVYLDDRAVRFTGPGSFPTRAEVHAAIPWDKAGRRKRRRSDRLPRHRHRHQPDEGGAQQ